MYRSGIHMMVLSLFFSLTLFAQRNNTTYSFRHYHPEHGLSNNSVYCFLEDEQGFMWIGTRNGLNRFDGYEFEVYDKNNSAIEGDYISTLCKGKGNRIWAGTLTDGVYLYSWKEDKFTPFISDDKDEGSLSSNRISSIVESSDGFTWIGTNGGGLNSIDLTTFEVKDIFLERSAVGSK